MIYQKKQLDILFWIFSVYIFMLLVFSRQFSYLQLAENLYITEVVIVVVYIGLMIRKILIKQAIFPVSFDAYIYYYLAVGLIFLIISFFNNGINALRGWIPFYLYSSFYFFIIKIVKNKKTYLNYFLFICFWGTIFSMFYRIFRMATDQFLFFNVNKSFGGSTTSLYASFSIFFILPILYNIKKYKLFIIIFLVLNSILILLSTTRGAIVSYLIAFLVFVFMDKSIKTHRMLLLGIPLMLILFWVFNGVFDFYSDQYLGSRSREFLTIFSSNVENAPPGTIENAAWRKLIWISFVNKTLDGNFLFGHFFGTPVKIIVFHKIYAGAEDVIQPHNSFIHLFFRTGIVGISSMLAIIFVFLKQMYRGFKTGSNVNQRLYLSIICVFIYYLVNASFNVVLESPYTGVFFWIIIGLGILIIEFDKQAIKII